MRRLIFAGIFCSTFAPPVRAQRVPGRDLLEITLGAGADVPALATESGSGIWNPAAAVLPVGARARLGAGALQGASDQGLGAQLLEAAVAAPRSITVGIAVLRASVDELVRTETDPQSIGGEIPYHTTLISLHAAQQRTEYLSAGLALRYRTGQLDGDEHGAFGADAGLLATGFGPRDVRVGASTFLWQPAGATEANATFHGGADLRIMGSDSTYEGRIGYGLAYTLRGAREHYGVASGRLSRLSGRIGTAYSEEFGHHEWRLRLGLGLHYARYVVGVVREENGAGMAPIYQFTLSALIR